ncbi:hypothetical protein K523DRAFT_388849, partial [Schizophyllum commune Tattone D]
SGLLHLHLDHDVLSPSTRILSSSRISEAFSVTFSVIPCFELDHPYPAASRFVIVSFRSLICPSPQTADDRPLRRRRGACGEDMVLRVRKILSRTARVRRLRSSRRSASEPRGRRAAPTSRSEHLGGALISCIVYGLVLFNTIRLLEEYFQSRVFNLSSSG